MQVGIVVLDVDDALADGGCQCHDVLGDFLFQVAIADGAVVVGLGKEFYLVGGADELEDGE